VGDEWAERQLKQQAREVFAESTLLALALTAVALLLPSQAA